MKPPPVSAEELQRLCEAGREGDVSDGPTLAVAEPPRPLFRKVAEATAYPVDALGPVLGPVARAVADLTQAPDAICANSVLAAAALAVQAHGDIKLPNGQVKPISLFLMTVAESGERKTSADNYALEGVRQREAELREVARVEMHEFQNRYEAFQKARTKILRGRAELGPQIESLAALGEPPREPAKPMILCSEPTPEGLVKLMAEGQVTIGLFSSEAGSFIGGHAMSDDSKLRTGARLNNMWDGTPIDRVRAGDGLSVIVGKRVSVHLMAQPEAATRFLADPTLRDLGVIGRLLISAPEPRAGTRCWREPAPESAALIRHFEERVLGLLRSAPPSSKDGPPRTIRMSDEARRIYIAEYDRIELQMAAEGRFVTVKPFASKMAEHAARIAAVLTLVADPEATTIPVEAIVSGFVLADHYAEEALRLAGAALVSEQLRVAEKLRRWFIEHGHTDVHLAQIYQYGPSEIRDAAKARSTMKLLEQHGFATPIGGYPVIDGRKRSEAWRIVPAIPSSQPR